MTRTMYDGIDSDAGVIPTAAQIVAGYIDGDYVWSDADWARFPHALHVRIATRATTNDGHGLDVETGDATPEQAVNWVLMRRAAGADPTVYCSASLWRAVRAAFATHDVPEPHWWIASYNGDTAIPAGAVAHQYASMTRWDLSSVVDYWPGVDPAPTTAAHAALEEDEMSTTSVNGRAGLSWAAGTRHVVQVTYDPSAGDPHLRVVLTLTTGPVELSLSPTKGTGNLEIPAQLISTCRGVIFELAPGSPPIVYDACAV